MRRHRVANQIHAPFGVGETAFLLGPDRGRQIDMRVFVTLDIGVRILHHQEFELLQRLADARGVGHRGHGIGGDQPQSLDLAGLDRREDVGLEQAALLGKEFRVHAPVARNFLAVLVFLQRPVTGQPGTR